MNLTRNIHEVSTLANDAPHPAVFAHLGVLDVLRVRAPRPSGRKPHWAHHLAGLATKPGEICRLRTQQSADRQSVLGSLNAHTRDPRSAT